MCCVNPGRDMDISGDEKNNTLKIVLVGDGAIGKTCMLSKILHAHGKLKDKDGEPLEFDIDAEYEATTFDTQILDGITHEGKVYDLELWDTAGQESLRSLRRLSYSDTQVFLLGFSINSLASLQNVASTWIPDITEYCPDAVIILAGFKADMRGGEGIYVETEKAQQLADEASLEDDANWIRAYIETSAKTGYNCTELLKLLVAMAVARIEDKLDEKFPTFKQRDDGSYPTVEELLAPPPASEKQKSPEEQKETGTAPTTPATAPSAVATERADPLPEKKKPNRYPPLKVAPSKQREDKDSKTEAEEPACKCSIQ